MTTPDSTRGDPDRQPSGSVLERPVSVAPDWQLKIQLALEARRAALGGQAEPPLGSVIRWPVIFDTDGR